MVNIHLPEEHLEVKPVARGENVHPYLFDLCLKYKRFLIVVKQLLHLHIAMWDTLKPTTTVFLAT